MNRVGTLAERVRSSFEDVPSAGEATGTKTIRILIYFVLLTILVKLFPHDLIGVLISKVDTYIRPLIGRKQLIPLNTVILTGAVGLFWYLAQPWERKKTTVFRIMCAIGWTFYALRYWACPNPTNNAGTYNISIYEAFFSILTDTVFFFIALHAYKRCQVSVEMTHSNEVSRSFRSAGKFIGLAFIALTLIKMLFSKQMVVQDLAEFFVASFAFASISIQRTCFDTILEQNGQRDKKRLFSLAMGIFAFINLVEPFVRDNKDAFNLLLLSAALVKIAYAYLFVWIKRVEDGIISKKQYLSQHHDETVPPDVASYSRVAARGGNVAKTDSTCIPSRERTFTMRTPAWIFVSSLSMMFLFGQLGRFLVRIANDDSVRSIISTVSGIGVVVSGLGAFLGVALLTEVARRSVDKHTKGGTTSS